MTDMVKARLLVYTMDVATTQGKKQHIKINKFAGLSQDWVGAKNLFMCFIRSFLVGEKKTHKQTPPPQKSRDNPGKCLFMCFFSLPNHTPGWNKSFPALSLKKGTA